MDDNLDDLFNEDQLQIPPVPSPVLPGLFERVEALSLSGACQ